MFDEESVKLTCKDCDEDFKITENSSFVESVGHTYVECPNCHSHCELSINELPNKIAKEVKVAKAKEVKAAKAERETETDDVMMDDPKMSNKLLNFKIEYAPSFSLITINLNAGQKMKAETGAMVYMDPSVTLTTTAKGGLLGGLKRSISKESFFVNEFTTSTGGKIAFAPAYPGDIHHLTMYRGENWIISNGAYMASSISIDTDSKFQGFKKGFFSGESMFFLEITAEALSDVFLAAYGGIQEFNLGQGEVLILDNGHLVAMEGKVKYDVISLGGLKTTIFGGEGLVLKVTGPGKLLIQTRAPASLISWISGTLPGTTKAGTAVGAVGAIADILKK